MLEDDSGARILLLCRDDASSYTCRSMRLANQGSLRAPLGAGWRGCPVNTKFFKKTRHRGGEEGRYCFWPDNECIPPSGFVVLSCKISQSIGRWSGFVGSKSAEVVKVYKRRIVRHNSGHEMQMLGLSSLWLDVLKSLTKAKGKRKDI